MIKSLLLLIALAGGGCAHLTGHTYRPPSGYVPNEVTAIAIAEAVLIPIYGRDRIERQKPLIAQRDGDIWRVEGQLPTDASGFVAVGGVASVRIAAKDGRILHVTHRK